MANLENNANRVEQHVGKAAEQSDSGFVRELNSMSRNSGASGTSDVAKQSENMTKGSGAVLPDLQISDGAAAANSATSAARNSARGSESNSQAQDRTSAGGSAAGGAAGSDHTPQTGSSNGSDKTPSGGGGRNESGNDSSTGEARSNEHINRKGAGGSSNNSDAPGGGGGNFAPEQYEEMPSFGEQAPAYNI